MSRRRTQKPKPPPRELRELWARVPEMRDCQGKCEVSCGPIGCSSLERKLIEDRTGKKLEAHKPKLDCSMLTQNGACSVYSIRPMICRLWGTTKALRCPFGCTPERWVNDREALELLGAAAALAGDPEGIMDREMIAKLSEATMASFHDFVRSGEQYPHLRSVIER